MTAPATAPPTYFIISGFPKCGNKWLQKMVFDCESVGCYANDPAAGLPLMCRMFLEHEGLMELLRREGVSVRDFAVRMFDATANEAMGPMNLSRRGRDEMKGFLRDLGVESAKIAPAPPTGPRPEQRFAHLLDPTSKPPYASRPWKAIGMPAMHTPVAELQRLFRDFRIINLLRDPRDITVSFFYHFLATMSPTLAMSFVRVNASTGEIEHNPKWKQAFGKRITRRLKEYFGQASPTPGLVHVVRYEDLLVNAATELKRILAFLGTSEDDAAIARIVKDRSFESATGGSAEQRNSMIRKGQAGDWANYFDRELLDALGRPFVDLVRELGYEENDEWTKAVPESAPEAFDFARFRVRRSTARTFIKYWDQSPQLQARYPDSWQDIEGDDCYFTWLEQHGGPEVQDWLTLARKLEDLWQVDIVEKAGR
ncbi:MAG TPA: sulfotransferase domain-containing protein [Phycisphaerales bacterium]|nr:sulfotransferase domain-containing protein [Phycisphaerales bacterium]